MTIHRVLLLGGDTLRTAAYRAVIERAAIVECSTMIYGRSSAPHPDVPHCVLASFDPADQSLLRIPWVSRATARSPEHGSASSDPSSIRDPKIGDIIGATSPDLIVFSGLPGEIVPASLVEKVPFLHAHPGELPAIRGSTAIYWSLLLGRPNSCSAILLSPEIDRGPIVLTRTFRTPAVSADLIDTFFDPCIRALTMISALTALVMGVKTLENNPLLGKDYYVIHPTLKAVALRRLQQDCQGL